VVAWGEIEGEGEAAAKVFRLHAGQRDVLMHPARFKGALAGTGGGKTVLGPIWLMREIKRCIDEGKVGKILMFVVAPTYPILARATAPTLVATFQDTDLEGRYVPSQNRYYLPHGLGVIWLLSADNPQGLEGGQADAIWVDEGGQLRYEAWLVLRSRTGQKQSPILITTTPYGTNWLYHVFYKNFLAGDPDYYVRQWSSITNPAYPKAEYDAAKASMSPQRAAMRYDGEFVRLAGLVYPELADCILEEHVDPALYSDGRRIGGIDWGWQNPFCALGATLFVNELGEDVLYVHYERYKRSTGLAEHAAALPAEHEWFADPSEPSSIHELRRAGIAVRKADNSIVVGVDAVSARICTRRLVISPRCKALIAEAEMYRYPERDDEPYGEKPIDENNHAMDALRYMVLGADKRKVASHARAA
jgi:phage terminase large subunit